MNVALYLYIILVFVLFYVEPISGHAYSKNRDVTCQSLGSRCDVMNDDECCEGMACVNTYIYTPDYTICIYPTLAAVPSLQYNLDCEIEYAKLLAASASDGISIGCGANINKIRFGGGFRNILIPKYLSATTPITASTTAFSSIPLDAATKWQIIGTKHPHRQDCPNLHKDFSFEIATKCCLPQWDTAYDPMSLNKLRGLHYKLHCDIASDWTPFDIQNAPTVSCGFNRLSSTTTSITTRTLYPQPEHCVQQGFDGIISQKCALQVYVGDTILKQSQYISATAIKTHDLLDEPLPRMSQNIATFECKHISDESNSVFCPSNEGYECVGGGFENVNEDSSTTDENNVWMNWPLHTKDGVVNGYDVKTAHCPYNGECKCNNKAITNNNDNGGGWAANYGISGARIKSHAVCCRMNQPLTDALNYGGSVPYDIHSASMGSSASAFAWISGGLYSFYSGWGTAFEVLTPSLGLTPAVGSMSCSDWNGVWSQTYEAKKKRFYCIKSREDATDPSLCSLTEIATNTVFASTSSTSPSIHYVWTSNRVSPSITIIGEISSDKKAIEWKQNGRIIFTWNRDTNPNDKDSFYQSIDGNQIVLSLHEFVWYRLGEKPPYPATFETCPNDYPVSKQYFVDIPTYANINNTVMNVFSSQTGASILKTANKGIIHLPATVNTQSNIKFSDLRITLDWFTTSAIYIELKYTFDQTVYSHDALKGQNNPCHDTQKARCDKHEGVSTPLKLTFDGWHNQFQSCSLGFHSLIDQSRGHCEGNQYQSNFPLGFKDNILKWDTVLKPFVASNICPPLTILYEIPTHSISQYTETESDQCGKESIKLASPHCVFAIQSDQKSSYFQTEYTHHWNVKLILNNKGCIAIKDYKPDTPEPHSLFIDEQCGIKSDSIHYLSPYFTVKFVEDFTTEPGVVHIEWRSWSTQKTYYLGYTAVQADYAISDSSTVQLFSQSQKPAPSQLEWLIDTNYQIIAKKANQKHTYCLWYDNDLSIVLMKCSYLYDKLIKEVSFVGGDTLSMDAQYAPFNYKTVDKTSNDVLKSDELGTMNAWGIMSSIGDKHKFKDEVYRKALMRIDPLNDGDIIRTAVGHIFDLVSTSCSLMGYNGHLVEFKGTDYRPKYEKSKQLCGAGVHYKCFIGITCDKHNGGTAKWISDDMDIVNADILSNYFAEPPYKTCNGSSTISHSDVYYYYIDGADGKIRRTSFDYNLKDIRMGICEIGETQLVCNKAVFVYAQIHHLSIESALNYYYIHGHKHRNLWPGHLCDPRTATQPLQGSASSPIRYLKMSVDDTVSDMDWYCQKKCAIDVFCSAYTAGTKRCEFQTNFDPSKDYKVTIDRKEYQILSGVAVIESASIGWNCKSNLFEQNVKHKIRSEISLIQTQSEFGDLFKDRFDDIGFIWITYIDLQPIEHRTMTENECIYLCYQHRSCVAVAFSMIVRYCVLYGAKLELPDYSEYMDFEKCHVHHLFSCVHTQYALQSTAGFYSMTSKTIQGGLRSTSFEKVTKINETLYDQITWIYYQYNSPSESFCKEECAQLQTCNIFAYHPRLFNGICFITITDSLTTLERPSGDWQAMDIEQMAITFPPWDISTHFDAIFNCFGTKPNFALCDNYPTNVNEAPPVPNNGFPITGIYRDSGSASNTVKVFPEYKQSIPNFKRYYHFKWSQAMFSLVSASHWSTYLEDEANHHIWSTHQWKTYPKKEFKIFDTSKGSKQYSFLIGAWIRQTTQSKQTKQWDFETNQACPVMNIADDWNDPTDANNKRFEPMTDIKHPNCDYKFKIHLSASITAVCTFTFAPKCKGKHTCCKQTEGISDNKRIAVYECDTFDVFLPHGTATKVIYQCTKERTATPVRTYTLIDTLHRKAPPRRRRMLQDDIPLTTEYKENDQITNILSHQNISSVLHDDLEKDKRRLMANNPGWSHMVHSGLSDCKNSGDDFYFIPGIEEDPCKELCFFSQDNGGPDGCANMFYSQIEVYTGCFVILKGNAKFKWKHGVENWIKMSSHDFMRTPFNVYQLKTITERAENEIPKREGWTDAFHNQQSAMQTQCDTSYDDGECRLNIQKPAICGAHNQAAIIELSYHCKLSDGSVSLTRNIRQIISKSETSTSIQLNCVSQYSIKVDDATNELFVSNLLDPVPFKEDIFYLNHIMENKFTLQRLKKNQLNGNTECIVYDHTNDKIELYSCSDSSFPVQYKHWLYWNNGKLSLQLSDGTYQWLSHNGNELMITSQFNEAVSWSFDGSFSGCKDEHCTASDTFKNTVTFNTNANKGFATPMFDPLYRKNSMFMNGWLMVSDTASLSIVAINMYFGRAIYKELLDIHHTTNDYDWHKARDIDYICGGNLVFMNGASIPQQNALYHPIRSLSLNNLFSELISFDNNLTNVQIWNDKPLAVDPMDERHFGIYYVVFDQISFDDKSDILAHFVFNQKFLERSDYFAHHQLVFKYPSYSYDTSHKRAIEPRGNADFGKLSNPYHCHMPYLPGIECIFECQWGYTSICRHSFAPSATIDPSLFDPYRIRQFKQFKDAQWEQDPSEMVHPQCCSVAQICSQHSELSYFYSPSNPSLIPELRATAICAKGKGKVCVKGGVTIDSDTFPFDAASDPIRVKCASDDLLLVNRGLMADYASYSRFCQFRDIEPHYGYISGPNPDCRGPNPLSQPIKPLIWGEIQSFLLNAFQCGIDPSRIPYLHTSASNTIPIYARVSTENSQIYKTECAISDSFGNIKFAQNKFLFKDQAISIAGDSAFPAWNDMINMPIVYSFGLPLGLWLDHSLQLKGFPFSSFEKHYYVRFCVSNLAHYPQNNVLFDLKRNCIDLNMEVLDPPPIVLYYPLNAHEFDRLDATHLFDSNQSHSMPLSQRHVLHTGQSFEIEPIIEPQFLLHTQSNNKSCSQSDDEVIDELFYETDISNGCDVATDCIGDMNKGFTLIKYTEFKNIAIFNHNQYFELLNINSNTFTTPDDALEEGKRKCKLICSLDKECQSIVLTKNDHRRIPDTEPLRLHLRNDDVYICDVFYDTQHIHYDRFEQSKSFYFKKTFKTAPPLYLKYRKIKCKNTMKRTHTISGLSIGHCQDDTCAVCNCIQEEYQRIPQLEALHYNLDFTHDVRIKHPNVELCNAAVTTDCIQIPKTCLCQSKSTNDPPLIDAMFGTSAECVDRGYSKQGLHINYGLIPFLIDLPPIFLCIKPWDVPEPQYTLSHTDAANGLNIKDMKRFLDLFQSPAEQIPLNKFIKVPNIQSRGFGVLPKFYKNNKLGVNLVDIGWNCYHQVATNNAYVTELMFMESSTTGSNVRRYNPLPLGFEMDSITGAIRSAFIPLSRSSQNVELQRYGHVTYHKCVVIYCNTAGCIANQVRFEILPSVPKYNPRHLDFYDRNREREILSGQIRWETVPTLDGYDDTHHFDIWIDEGFNIDGAVKLYQSIIKHNELLGSTMEQTQMNDVYYRRGYRFLVVVSCSTLWCFNGEYNMSTASKMRLDDNEYYTEHTNLVEFFDFGDKPFYSVVNITSVPFIDLDGNEHEIGGVIQFIPPKLYEHQEYKLYAGICAECRDYLVASVLWEEEYLASPNEVVIPFDTQVFESTYLILVTANEHGENDKNVYVEMKDEVYHCTEWNACDKSCLLSDYQHNDNAKPITSSSDVLGWSSCVLNPNFKRECHRFVCPLSKVTIWPSQSNFDPPMNYQIQNNRAYVTALYRNSLSIYQKYSFKQSRSKLKITAFGTDDSCKDRLTAEECRDLVKKHQCLKNPLSVLPQCQYSCGACQSKWDMIQIPPHSDNDALRMDIPMQNMYVRDIFIRSAISGYLDEDYVVSVGNITQSNAIPIRITSLVNRYGWSKPLQLIYVLDSIAPVYQQIEYDAAIVSDVIYERHNEKSIQYHSMIPMDIHSGVIRVEVMSYFDASFTECNVSTKEWRYEPFDCGSISNIIFITMLREESLSSIHKQCLFYYVEYDEYDRWLTESFAPSFDPNHYFYHILDENPGNEYGELHLHIGCHSNLTWFIQIGIESEWQQWLVGGFNKLANSDRFLTPKLNEKSGAMFVEELRRYLIRIADLDKLVPADPRIPMTTDISIKVVDKMYSDTYVLTCVRLPDMETTAPILMKPEYGDIVPTGFSISFVIKEDAYRDTLELIIKPRESAHYVTDDTEQRMITLRENTWIGEANTAHSIKFCSSLSVCMETEMNSVIAAIEPSDNLIEFSLYDFILRYQDRWHNPVASDQVNEVMIVRDWSEDLHVLRVIYDRLNGRQWFVSWDIDNDATNYCDSHWYGIKCNSLKQIVSLNLFSNNLYGELPPEIGKLSSLEYLDLASNYITGTIPMTIQLLHMIEYISFASNSLIGSIPNGIENMNNLKTLNLAGNMLSGSIPNGLLLSAKQSNLKNIYLNANRLSGFIPLKFKDMTRLNTLYLSDNDWYCVEYTNVDYSKWAKHTDFTSINTCIQPPKHVLQSDIKPPLDLI
eukprot:400875_1